MMRWSFLPLAVALVIVLPADQASAFTAEQAAAGRTSYGQVCVACHGADLQTLPNARLVGPDFASRWENRGVNELLSKVRATMPPEGPGALPENIYLNVLAYILQQNGANPGTERLTTATRTTIGSIVRRDFSASSLSPLRQVNPTRTGFQPAR
jgi:mono/diheme cytochrome c family protein